MRNTLLTIIAVIFGTFCAHAQNISFTDPIVKAICVSNWDTNGDGEIDIADATLIQMYLAEFITEFPADV